MAASNSNNATVLCIALKIHTGNWRHVVASQRSLHNAPIFRLLLKVAVKGTHQCDFINFWGRVHRPTNSLTLRAINNSKHAKGAQTQRCAHVHLLMGRLKDIPLSTVLAQDHFYSDFWAFTWTNQIQHWSMMMFIICTLVEQPKAYFLVEWNLSVAIRLNGLYCWLRASLRPCSENLLHCACLAQLSYSCSATCLWRRSCNHDDPCGRGNDNTSDA